VSKLRVLLVDDEAVFTHALRRLLQRTFDVEVAGDGREALAAIQRGARFDVILSDVMMPQLSGLELHEEVQRLAPDQARRFIFLTGGAFGGDVQPRLRALGGRQLEKPIDVAALRAMIAQVAAEHGPRGGCPAGGH
jgi:CheY-like chemotaxis protein